MINSKTNCANDLSAAIKRTANWRRGLKDKYSDPRCERAADALDQLSADAQQLSDELFERLKMYYSWASGKWADAISTTGRQVGFRPINTLSEFVDQLVAILSQQSAAA